MKRRVRKLSALVLTISTLVCLYLGNSWTRTGDTPISHQLEAEGSIPKAPGISIPLHQFSDYGAARLYRKFFRDHRTLTPKHEDTNTDQEMLSRYIKLDNLCRKENINTSWWVSDHTLVNKQYSFSVCFVPKIGCTFWKTVIYLLGKGNISPQQFTAGLMNPNKDKIHTVKLRWLSQLGFEEALSFFRSSKAVIFTRNPYTRLFSAYVDKFILPSFWNTIGTEIVRRFRLKVSDRSLKCGHDVTFEEFLRYVIDVEQTGRIVSGTYDDHWAPVTSLCHVCRIKYDYIGKQESFSKDTEYIFQQLGLDELLTTNITNIDSIRYTIEQTISSFASLPRGLSCVTGNEILHRIWYTLQTQGYMTFDSEPPWWNLDLSTATRPEVVQAFQTSYDQNKPTAEQRKQQRHKALIDAYSTVPVEVKRGIQHVFRYDFELFGYDKDPHDLFDYG